jgi:AcrR family transcriptional regulator
VGATTSFIADLQASFVDHTINYYVPPPTLLVVTPSPPEVRKRKSPTERRAEVTRAARSLALEAGLSAVTLRGIATTMGVASGLVAHYEPSMESLLARTFADIATDELLQIQATIETDQGPLARFVLLVAALLDPARDDVSAVWADAWSLSRRLPLVAEATRTSMDAWHALAVDLLRSCHEARILVVPDPDLVAFQLFALIDSATAYGLADYLPSSKRAERVRTLMERSLHLPEGALNPLRITENADSQPGNE